MVVVEPVSVLILYTVLYSVIVRPHRTVIEMNLTFSFEKLHTAHVELMYFISLTYPSYTYVDCLLSSSTSPFMLWISASRGSVRQPMNVTLTVEQELVKQHNSQRN